MRGILDRCPNCSEVRAICDCTWDEILRAREILRQQAAKRRRDEGRPTVVEREAARSGGGR